jgi:hypothetical protein
MIASILKRGDHYEGRIRVWQEAMLRRHSLFSPPSHRRLRGHPPADLSAGLSKERLDALTARMQEDVQKGRSPAW